MDSSKIFSPPNCATCHFRSSAPFCSLLSQAEIDLLMAFKKGQRYEKGQAVFYEGNSCDAVYLLCSGSLKLVQSSHEGQQQILEVCSPGSWVDQGSFFSSSRHAISAVALERCELSLFSRDDFSAILKSEPNLSQLLISMLSQAVEKGRERSSHLLFRSALERLAHTLLELAAHHGVMEGELRVIKLALKREELAEMIGVTQETVVRLLTFLRKEKIIRLIGRDICLLDEARLSQIKK